MSARRGGCESLMLSDLGSILVFGWPEAIVYELCFIMAGLILHVLPFRRRLITVSDARGCLFSSPPQSTSRTSSVRTLRG